MKYKSLLALMVLLSIAFACTAWGTPATEPSAPPANTEAATEPQNAAPTFTQIPTFTSVPPATEEPVLSQTLIMQSSLFEEAGAAPPYTIKAQIPYLEGSSDGRVQGFNTLLKQVAQLEIDSFRNNTLTYASNPPLTPGSFLKIGYSVIGQRGDVWSIKYDISFYSDGAAHPGHYSITVNYDLARGSELFLPDIFLPGSNYLQVISDYCKSELATRDIGFDGFSGGADPLPENYTRWNLSTEGLVITFDEYQVAPYAAGAQVVTVPFSVLQNVTGSGGVIELFAQ